MGSRRFYGKLHKAHSQAGLHAWRRTRRLVRELRLSWGTAITRHPLDTALRTTRLYVFSRSRRPIARQVGKKKKKPRSGARGSSREDGPADYADPGFSSSTTCADPGNRAEGGRSMQACTGESTYKSRR
jgi:hypothetical protein